MGKDILHLCADLGSWEDVPKLDLYTRVGRKKPRLSPHVRDKQDTRVSKVQRTC